MKILTALAGIVLAAAAPLYDHASAAEARIRPVTAETWSALKVAADRHPLIVHFWGLTCGTCMAELGDWSALIRAHPNARIILINWDQRSVSPERLAVVLAKAGLDKAESYALANGFEEKLRFGIDPQWMGELPYTRLLWPGRAATSFSGAANFNDLRDWLAAKP